MNTPAAKRRRVDTAHETLRKPFKSPMVRDREGRGAGSAAAEDAAAPSPQPKPRRDTRADSGSAAVPDNVTATVATTPRGQGARAITSAARVSSPTRRPLGLPGPQLSVSPSPLGTSLHGARSASKVGASAPGTKMTREAEGREEIIRQAGRIRRGGGGETDSELVGLIEKWRAASRIAAEEVFEGSRERVERMGGLKAWRRAEREDGARFAERMREAEEEGEWRGRGLRDGDLEESSPEDMGDEQVRAGGGGEDDEDEASNVSLGTRGRGADKKQEFTMGTMLRSMNIAFDIIGYDEDTGWWRDA